MTGSIYKRKRPGKDPRWHAVIDLPRGADGRRRQKTTTHATRRDAQAWLAQTVLELRAGEVYDTKIMVGHYLSSWLEGKQALRPSTRSAYGVHVELHLVPALGHFRLLDLRAHHIDAMYRGIAATNRDRERPVGPATMRRIHATLTSALNTAVQRGLIRRNPAATVELPRGTAATTTVWTATEAAQFLDATREDTLHLLYRLLLVSGLRRGEVVGLRWTDVDLEQGVLSVVQQVVLVEGKSHVGPPKSSRGVRSIALDSWTVDLLVAYRRRTTLCYPGAEIPEGQLVFTRSDCQPVSPAFVSRHFENLVARAGLPRIRLHDLRHTSASLGLAQGESLLEVSRRLGHSSITITADVYAHVPTDAAQRSAQTLADRLNTN